MSIAQPLAGRHAVVTGASRGIGAAVATALGAAGAAVVLCARDAKALAALADELGERGVRAVPAACDVTDPDSVAALADLAAEQLGSIDILVNNAGIAHSAPLHHQTLEDWNRLFAVNVTGTFLCTKAFAPAMAQNRRGRIVNVASLAARKGDRYISAYAASKHAVLGFTRSIAAEMADREVTVNAVCPGYVDTAMTDETIERIMSKTALGREEALASILATTPQRRLVQPEEVAFVVTSLCRDEARGINGQAIGIDGGEFMG